jgi:hypothetical protein
MTDTNGQPSWDLLDQATRALREDLVPPGPPNSVRVSTVEALQMSRSSGAVASEARVPFEIPGSEPARPTVLTSAPTASTPRAASHRRWFLALTLGFLAGAIVAPVMGYFSPDHTYTARTVLHVWSHRPLFTNALPDPNGDVANYQQTQLQLLKNRSVLNAALRDPRVKDLPIVKNQVEPVTWLEKQVAAEFNGEILRISINGSDPEQITLLLDAVRDNYLKEAVGKDHKKRLDHLEQLKAIYATTELQLRDKQMVLQTVLDDLGAKDAKMLAIRQEFALKEINAIQMELLDVQAQLRKLQLDVQNQAEPAKDVTLLPVPNFLVEEYMKQDKRYNAWSKHVAKLEERLAYLKKNFAHPEKEPDWQELNDGLKEAKQGLAACREKLRPAAVKAVRDKFLGGHQPKGSAQERIDYLNKLKEMLIKEIELRTRQNKVAAKNAADREWLKDEIALKEDQVKKVGMQIQDLEVEILAPRRINLMEETVVVDNGDKRPKMAALGFFGAFGLVVLGGAYLEFRARRVSN